MFPLFFILKLSRQFPVRLARDGYFWGLELQIPSRLSPAVFTVGLHDWGKQISV